MKPSEIVEGALEILEEKGWCRGSFVDDAGRVCVLEALSKAALGEQLLAYKAGDAVWVAAGFSLGDRRSSALHSLPGWNDGTKGLTADKVKDVLTTAAKTLRDQGE